MLAISSPAPIAETLELLAASRAGLKPWQPKAMLLQLLGSLTVAFRDGEGGRLVAAAGFFPLPPERDGEEASEIWFLCRPELARHLAAFVRLARLTCRRASQDGLVRLRAFVRAGEIERGANGAGPKRAMPGARLAVLVGLERVATVNGFELWEWRGGSVSPADHGHAVRPARARRGVAAGGRQPAHAGGGAEPAAAAPGAGAEPD